MTESGTLNAMIVFNLEVFELVQLVRDKSVQRDENGRKKKTWDFILYNNDDCESMVGLVHLYACSPFICGSKKMMALNCFQYVCVLYEMCIWVLCMNDGSKQFNGTNLLNENSFPRFF